MHNLIEGCRHVAKTGDIKNFVIVEESGIAKGIRRIIAVTGHEAAEVTRQAKTLSATLDQIERASGKDKDQMLKTLQVVRNSAPSLRAFLELISYIC